MFSSFNIMPEVACRLRLGYKYEGEPCALFVEQKARGGLLKSSGVASSKQRFMLS